MPFALLNHIGPPPKNNKEVVQRLLRILVAVVIVFGVIALISWAVGE